VRPLVAAQRIRQLEAVEPWHLHVGQNQVGAFESRASEPEFSVLCFQDTKARQLEADRTQQPGRGVIVDDQDAGGLRSSFGRCG